MPIDFETVLKHEVFQTSNFGFISKKVKLFLLVVRYADNLHLRECHSAGVFDLVSCHYPNLCPFYFSDRTDDLVRIICVNSNSYYWSLTKLLIPSLPAAILNDKVTITTGKPAKIKQHEKSKNTQVKNMVLSSNLVAGVYSHSPNQFHLPPFPGL